jgi:predicted PurR-regulated permease PerM
MNSTDQPMKASQILLTIAAFIIVVAGMRAAVDILVPFLLAAFIAIISAAPLFWLQRKGLPAWLALLIIISSIFLIGFLMAWLVGSSVKDFSDNLPTYEDKFRQQTTAIIGWLSKLGIDTSNLELTKIFNPASAMKLVAAGLNSLGNVLTNGLLIITTVIFMLLEATSIPAKLRFIVGEQDSSMAPFEKFIGNVKNYMAIKTIVSLASGICVAVSVCLKLCSQYRFDYCGDSACFVSYHSSRLFQGHDGCRRICCHQSGYRQCHRAAIYGPRIGSIDAGSVSGDGYWVRWECCSPCR